MVHIYIHIMQQFSLIHLVFWINVVKLCKPLSKLDLPTLRKGSTEERTQRNKWKIWHSLGLEPGTSAFLVPMLYPLSYGCHQFEGTVVSNVPSGVWHLDCILITWPTRRSRRLRIVRLKGINLARWVSSAVDIVSGQVMPNAARTNWRWDASICRHSERVMGTDSNPYAAIVSTVALKRRILLASLILIDLTYTNTYSKQQPV